jgi:hypothetical protein
MTWKRIQTQAVVDDLMRQLGDFHDSVVREAHLWTEHRVAEVLAMGIVIGP